MHALSLAVSSPSGLDVNLKLFDILGRVSLKGIWLSQKLQKLNASKATKEQHREDIKETSDKLEEIITSLKLLIKNNPVLLQPFKDSQAIELGLAFYLLSQDSANDEFLKGWLEALIEGINFSFIKSGMFPTTLESFQELLLHKNKVDRTPDYKEKVTRGSILYPLLITYCALYDLKHLSETLLKMVEENLSHCTLQYWYPDKQSEEIMYANTDIHGVATTNFPVKLDEVLEHVLTEARESNQFWEMSAVKAGKTSLVLLACRYYRYPIPLNLLEDWISISKMRESH